MDTYQAFLAAATSATKALDSGQLDPREPPLIAVAARELAERMEEAADKHNLPHP